MQQNNNSDEMLDVRYLPSFPCRRPCVHKMSLSPSLLRSSFETQKVQGIASWSQHQCCALAYRANMLRFKLQHASVLLQSGRGMGGWLGVQKVCCPASELVFLVVSFLMAHSAQPNVKGRPPHGP